MTAQITTLTIKDGIGADRTVQAVDLSGTGAGPWSFLHGLVDRDGNPHGPANPLVIAGSAVVGSAPTNPPLAVSGIDQAGLKRHLRTDGVGNLAVQNAPLRLRDQFESDTLGTAWTVAADPSDLVFYDGNALGAGYLVISKDPMAAGTETVVESVATFAAPFRAGFGVSLSQRIVGQPCAIEVVSTDAPIAAVADAAVASIAQTTTTLTVTTVAAHGLRPGDRVSVDGVVANNALNYPQLVVATVPSVTQFTASGYPSGTIPSLTAGPYATGTVRRLDHIGRAPDGSALIFEGNGAAAATLAARAGGTPGAVTSGNANGIQTTTILSSASVQALAAAGVYAFTPTTLYELVQQAEVIEWLNVASDVTNSALSPIFKRNQIVPDPAKSYRVRYRATNTPSLARPVAGIVSAAKSGTSTATVTTDRPHGLATGETVTLYGIRDTTNFANLTVATAVTVIDATRFTVTLGSAVTATSYGGVVCRAGGGQVQGGIASMVVQSAATDATGRLTVMGSAAWSGPVIGDTVSLYGLRSAADGSSLGLDGAWRVRDIATTSLVLEPIGSTAAVANLASVNCGGAVVKRTDLRLHFVRAEEVTRLVTETMGGMARTDTGMAPQVYMVGTGTMQGAQAEQSASSYNGMPAMVQTLSAPPAAGTTGRRSTVQGDLAARPVVRPIGMPQANSYGRATLTTTTETQLLAATASNRWEIDNVVVANRDTVAHTVDIRDALAGTVRWSVVVAAGATCHLPLRGAPASAVNAAVTAALREAATTAVEVAVNAYLTTA